MASLAIRNVPQHSEWTTVERRRSSKRKQAKSNHGILPPEAYWKANAVVDPTTGAAIEYAQLKIGTDSKDWLHSCANKIGHLAQGILPGIPTGSNTMHFIHRSYKPADRRAVAVCFEAILASGDRFHPAWQVEVDVTLRSHCSASGLDRPGRVPRSSPAQGLLHPVPDRPPAQAVPADAGPTAAPRIPQCWW